MGVEPNPTQSSSGETDSESDSDNSDSCSYASSSSDSDSSENSHGSSHKSEKTAEKEQCNKPKQQRQFSVTSSETGIKLRIAAIPRDNKTTANNKQQQSPKKRTPVPTAAAKKSNYEKTKEHQAEKRPTPGTTTTSQTKAQGSGNKAKMKSNRKSATSSSESSSECSDSDSSSDNSESESQIIVSSRIKTPVKSVKNGPKLTATVYSKTDDSNKPCDSESDVPIKSLGLKHPGESQGPSGVASGNEDSAKKSASSAKCVGTRSKSQKKVIRSANDASPEKKVDGKVKRIRGRPRIKAIQDLYGTIS